LNNNLRKAPSCDERERSVAKHNPLQLLVVFQLVSAQILSSLFRRAFAVRFDLGFRASSFFRVSAFGILEIPLGTGCRFCLPHPAE